MFDKNAFLASVAQETEICKHLQTKLTEASLDYTPGEAMRNTRELLGYLTICGVAPVQAMIGNDWSVVGPHMERAKNVTAENFVLAMDNQLRGIEAAITPLTEDDFTRDAAFPWGGSTQLGTGLVDLPLKFLAAYRLQLFCYIKASGSSELNTFNAWLGMDKPEQA